MNMAAFTYWLVMTTWGVALLVLLAHFALFALEKAIAFIRWLKRKRLSK